MADDASEPSLRQHILTFVGIMAAVLWLLLWPH